MINPEIEAEWDIWERRNPGVAHPGRIKYRNDQGRQKFIDDWADAQGIRRKPETFAERARRARMGM